MCWCWRSQKAHFFIPSVHCHSALIDHYNMHWNFNLLSEGLFSNLKRLALINTKETMWRRTGKSGQTVTMKEKKITLNKKGKETSSLRVGLWFGLVGLDGLLYLISYFPIPRPDIMHCRDVLATLANNIEVVRRRVIKYGFNSNGHWVGNLFVIGKVLHLAVQRHDAPKATETKFSGVK